MYRTQLHKNSQEDKSTFFFFFFFLFYFTQHTHTKKDIKGMMLKMDERKVCYYTIYPHNTLKVYVFRKDTSILQLYGFLSL